MILNTFNSLFSIIHIITKYGWLLKNHLLVSVSTSTAGREWIVGRDDNQLVWFPSVTRFIVSVLRCYSLHCSYFKGAHGHTTQAYISIDEIYFRTATSETNSVLNVSLIFSLTSYFLRSLSVPSSSVVQSLFSRCTVGDWTMTEQQLNNRRMGYGEGMSHFDLRFVP